MPAFETRTDSPGETPEVPQDPCQLYEKLAGRKFRVTLALVGAMLLGRAVWGVVSFAVYALMMENAFALTAFWLGAFVNAWPGIGLQLILVPLIVKALARSKAVAL